MSYIHSSNRMMYFRLLRALMSTHGNSYTFDDWVKQTYGVRVIYDHSGYITADYEVVDEKKYLLFALKFSY